MDEIQAGLETIVESLGGIPEGRAVEFWEELAHKLARIVGQDPAWSWRYPQGVLKGTIKPSKLFVSAVYALGAAIDEVPTSVVYTVQVRVYAKPGTVEEGSVILGASKPCKRPGCKVRIVPSVPWRKYCSDECKRLDEKERKMAQRLLKRNGKSDKI
jgi:hypothetical protein